MTVMRCNWLLPCLGYLLLATGCVMQSTAPAPATGDASWQMKTPAASQRYQLAVGDTATGANPARTVTPIYPASQLAVCPPPQHVQALLIVDGTGKVAEVRIAGGPQADEQRMPFNQAVRNAALQWRFNPLQVQHEGVDAKHDPVVVSEVRPFSMSYVFRFACHAGKPTLTSEKATADPS